MKASKRIIEKRIAGEEYITPSAFAYINKTYVTKIYYYINTSKIPITADGLMRKSLEMPVNLKAGRPFSYSK